MRCSSLALSWTTILLVPTAAALGASGYVGIYSDSSGTQPCGTVAPYTVQTLYVIAKLEGFTAAGITGAEFRIEVLDATGWLFSYAPPTVAGVQAIGGALDLTPNDSTDASGINLAFQQCQPPTAGQVRLGKISVVNLGGQQTSLSVKRHTHPSNPANRCASFTMCDSPEYSMVCMSTAAEPPCTIHPLVSATSTAGDESVFSLELNSASEASAPPAEAGSGSIFVMFKPGVVALPVEANLITSLTSSTVTAPAVLDVLQSHQVTALGRMYPEIAGASRVATSLTGTPVALSDLSQAYLLTIPDKGDIPALISALQGKPEVLVAEGADWRLVPTSCTIAGTCSAPVDPCPDDPAFVNGTQWSLVNAGQSGGTCGYDSHVSGVWSLQPDGTGASSTILGVLDPRGVEATHAELAGRVLQEFGPSGVDLNSPNPWHGTHVAGVMAANANNSTGMAGIDWQAGLVIGRNTTGPDAYNIIRAMVAFGGAHVTNHSYIAGYDPSCTFVEHPTSLATAFRDAYMLGSISVASIGQPVGDCLAVPAVADHWPAGLPGVIGVTAYDRTGNRQASAFRSPHVDVAAPGTSIYSLDLNNGFRVESGTSMAAPHVAGIISLLKARLQATKNIVLAQEDAENLLANGASNLAWNDQTGWGRVDAVRSENFLKLPHVFRHGESSGSFAAIETVDIPNFLVFVPLDGNTPPTVPANFYWARRTKWRTHVEFDLSEATKPIVAVTAWGRGAASVGFSADNPSFAYGWCGATNVTATGCDLDTYQYEIRECSGPSCAPGQVVGVFPATAALHVEYSFLGFPDVATSIGSEDAVDGVSAPLTLTVVAGFASERALVKIGLGGAATTRVAVYNVAGQRVRTLHDGTMPRGLHEISWGLTDEHGARVPSGLYLVSASAGTARKSAKLVVLR